MPLDLQRPAPIPMAQLRHSALQRHLEQVAAATAVRGATKQQQYLQLTWGGTLTADTYSRAQYLLEVRRRPERQALAQLRTGSHWLLEERGRMNPHIPREQRVCPHCNRGIEDAAHAVFSCPLYAP